MLAVKWELNMKAKGLELKHRRAANIWETKVHKWENLIENLFIKLKSHKEMFNIKRLLSYRLNTSKSWWKLKKITKLIKRKKEKTKWSNPQKLAFKKIVFTSWLVVTKSLASTTLQLPLHHLFRRRFLLRRPPWWSPCWRWCHSHCWIPRTLSTHLSF